MDRKTYNKANIMNLKFRLQSGALETGSKFYIVENKKKKIKKRYLYKQNTQKKIFFLLNK